MRKKILVIVLTVLIFLSAALLGTTSVFRVDSVTLVSSVVSAQAKQEANELRARLNEAYAGDGIFFADETEANEILQDFPYFRLTRFEKEYPNRLRIEVTEDAEVYAVESQKAGEYFILGGDGTVLEIRDSYLNRLDGSSNVVIKGLSVSGEKGKPLSGGKALDTLLAFCGRVGERLNGLRDNILSVTVTSFNPEYTIKTSEGVTICVADVERLTKEKADAVIDKYLSLSDEERLWGKIMAGDDGEKVVVTYDENGF